MRQTSAVLYIAIDDFLDSRGVFPSGFDDFTATLDREGVPAVWLSSRTRLQLDAPRRMLGHRHPFVAEDGSGIFLPQDYFHLRPQASSGPKKNSAATVRLGRFTCLPVAKQQPAAEEALEDLAADSGLAVVPIRSLSPRELAQNLGLQPREADLARQRDFDEIFFFAGADAEEIQRFKKLADSRRWQLRERGALWSLAVGPDVQRCIRELSRLYDRALHAHVRTVALAVGGQNRTLGTTCDRTVLLADAPSPSGPQHSKMGKVIELPNRSEDRWERILGVIASRA